MQRQAPSLRLQDDHGSEASLEKASWLGQGGVAVVEAWLFTVGKLCWAMQADAVDASTALLNSSARRAAHIDMSLGLAPPRASTPTPHLLAADRRHDRILHLLHAPSTRLGRGGNKRRRKIQNTNSSPQTPYSPTPPGNPTQRPHASVQLQEPPPISTQWDPIFLPSSMARRRTTLPHIITPLFTIVTINVP